MERKLLIQSNIPSFGISMEILAGVLKLSETDFATMVARAPNSYHTIELVKKSGGVRNINAPNFNLKQVQRGILDRFLRQIPLLPQIYGFYQGRSIVENAKAHLSNPYLFNADIVNFFPSVHHTRVLALFNDLGFDENIAGMLTQLTTLNNCLPQGAPTSPYLATLALNRLDVRLFSLCRLNRLTYTRYFDDITISGGKRTHEIVNTVESIIQTEGYSMHREEGKFSLSGPKDEKCVTGILITNNTLKVRNSDTLLQYLLELQQGLHMLEGGDPAKEEASLVGKISFINRVDPTFGRKLTMEFQKIKW